MSCLAAVSGFGAEIVGIFVKPRLGLVSWFFLGQWEVDGGMGLEERYFKLWSSPMKKIFFVVGRSRIGPDGGGSLVMEGRKFKISWFW
jgi:hypothetical protein